MNTQFVKYLTMLENAAPDSRKAEFRAARELYCAGKANPLNESWLSDSLSGKTAKTQTFGGSHLGLGAGARSPEQVAADKQHADEVNDAIASFGSASKTITTAATHDPGMVDAWVDFRLKPAIDRAMNSSYGIANADEVKAGAKASYNKYKDKFKAEDDAAAKREKDELDYAFEKAADDEKEIAAAKDADTLKASAAKRDELGKNRDYKWDASMPLNATDTDVNTDIATKRSDDLEKREFADKAYNEFEKKSIDNGLSGGVSTPEKKVDDEKAKQADDAWAKAQEFWSNDDIGAFESISDVRLRAVFESVYGSSAGYSDKEIRAICESCYRRGSRA